MARYYRHVGFVDQSSRPERVEVEAPTAENPKGKVLILDGDPVELSDDQVTKISQWVRLQPVDAEEATDHAQQTIDQPVNPPMLSQSTDGNTGTSPDFDEMELKGVKEYLSENDVSGRSTKDETELRTLAKTHYNESLEG